MHVQQKEAWFTLIVGLATAVLFGIGLVLCHLFRIPWMTAGASFGLLGLWGLTPYIYRRERRKGKIIWDERDTDIMRVANGAAYGVFWLLFVLGAMTPFFAKGPNATITMRTADIAFVVFPAMYVVAMVRSLAIAIQYKKGDVHENAHE